MTSSESSASDGEIVEAINKAKIAPSDTPELGNDSSSRAFGLDGTSDRYDYYRRYRNRSPSRSPSPFRHNRKRDRSRSRSPSPFRHNRDDRNRDGRYSYPSKRKASPPRDSRPEKRYQSGRDQYYNRRQAPYENSRAGARQPDTYTHRDHGSNKYANSRNVHSGRERHEYTHSPRDESTRNGSAGRIGQDRNQRHGAAFGASTATKPSEPAHPTDVEMTAPAEEEPDFNSLIVTVDEAPSQETREEKKRRWAAMRAQHAATGNNQSLLQQAVHASASEATTPNLGSLAALGDSPGSPAMDSMPASPDVMTIAKKEESEEKRDSPSDVLDDRSGADQKAQDTAMPASAYDETDPKFLSTLPEEKAVPAKKKKKDIDMFALSDEDNDGDEDAEDDEEQAEDAKGTVLDAKLMDNWDDTDGYYKIIGKELVNHDRYKMVKILGRGMFANVAQAVDMKDPSGKLVAIKIVRRNDAMKKASQREMGFLRSLNEEDPDDKKHIVRLLGSFMHKNHLCIVFEHLEQNLRDLLKVENNRHGLTLTAVKKYGRQMFSALKHLQHCKIIHADLKPDNILISVDKKTVKICDFGTALDTRDNNDPSVELVSRFYRAPEIILQMEVGSGIDMWAIGCTLFELWTGKFLFAGNTNNGMVKAFMEGLGWPSEKLLRKGKLSYEHYEPGPPLKFRSLEIDKFGKPVTRIIEQQKGISHPLKGRVHEAGRNIKDAPSKTELNEFADLLSACLNWNVEKRIQPKEAFAHKCFGVITAPNVPMPRPTVIKPTLPRRGPGARK